jgi:hypothetical protein
MKTKIMTREELEAALRRVLSDVTDADERHFVVGHLFSYANTMELVQRIPTALRLKFFACAFVIYDYLRSNGQLDRTERIFDKEVMRNLGKTLRMLGTELYDEH